jgi:hypothetical protein
LRGHEHLGVHARDRLHGIEPALHGREVVSIVLGAAAVQLIGGVPDIVGDESQPTACHPADPLGGCR